ncbi:SIMPL domain-containing protein [Candidatus Pacearchaeota archaeon]|nr:SIMPL domain-containing protein [Candidatus Pacearchaeota archaeon]
MELGKNAVLVILVVAFLAIGAYVLVNTPNLGLGKQTISVTGNSEASASPDVVSVYINIETLNKSAEDSKNANSRISENVIRELKYLGFKESEIETAYFNIYEDFSWNYANRQQESNGYKTVNQLKIKISDNDLIGKVIDAAVDNGALVNGVNFELSSDKENTLKAQVLEKATADAKTQAEAIAKGAGKKLGSLVSVTNNQPVYYPWVAYARAEGAAADAAEAKRVATQVNPGEIKVSASVQAVYSLR